MSTPNGVREKEEVAKPDMNPQGQPREEIAIGAALV
jgi:hypothetical protein